MTLLRLVRWWLCSLFCSLWIGGCVTVIEIAVIAVGVVVVIDLWLVALADVRFMRRRVDRRFKRG